MTEQELLEKFKELGVLKTGHFRLTSGLHSAQYMQCAAVFEYPKAAEEIVKLLIPKLPQDIDTVMAPAIGGINLGYEVARILGCRIVFAEREQGKMVLRRGFALTPGERVLVVEDVVTTGGSVKEVLEIARSCGCSVQGVGCIVDRSQDELDFQAPFVSLVRVAIETYQPDQCPLCLAGQPLTKPGSRDIN